MKKKLREDRIRDQQLEPIRYHQRWSSIRDQQSRESIGDK